MKKKILLGLLAVLVIIQFIQPQRNTSNEDSKALSKTYKVPENVASILKIACNDCHSNNTVYPWYANIQPVAWWLDHHIHEAKGELNFSTFTARKVAYQNHKFEEIIEQMENKEMPLPSYTYFGLHHDANLTDAQRNTLITWAKTCMDSLKTQYPADSLILRRPPTPPQ